jgi:hypothetical protein
MVRSSAIPYWKKVAEQYHIKHLTIVAHHPQFNGLTERSNKKIIEVLRSVVQDMPSSWEDWLDMTVACINSIITEGVGKSPHSIIFGKEIRLPYDLLDNESPLYNFDDYCELQRRAFQRINKEVEAKLKSTREKQKIKQHRLSKSYQFHPGMSVMVQSPDRTSKMMPRFFGPFTVITKIQNRLVVRNNATDSDELVHCDRVKPVSCGQAKPSEAVVPDKEPDCYAYLRKLRSMN